MTQEFVDWCQWDLLQINGTKEKPGSCGGYVPVQPCPTYIVDSHKYPGVHLSNKLDCANNADALYMKGESRLNRRRLPLSAGGVLEDFLRHCGGISHPLWRDLLEHADKKRHDRLIKQASSVLGCSLDSVQLVGESRMIANLSSHPMQDTITALSSSFSNTLLHPECV